MRIDDPVLIGPYAAYLLTIVFCSLLLKAIKGLMQDVKDSFEKTIEMFSKELKNCQEDREMMLKRIMAVERRDEKP